MFRVGINNFWRPRTEWLLPQISDSQPGIALFTFHSMRRRGYGKHTRDFFLTITPVGTGG